jgi:hypothetical protein
MIDKLPLHRARCAFIFATLLLAARPAIAQKPAIVLLPFTGGVAPTQDVCGFDIGVTPQEGRPNGERLILFGNTGIIAGPLFNTLTNLSTGKSIDVNVGGPGHLTLSETTTTVVAVGPGVFWSHPLSAELAAAAGLPRVFLLHGRIVFTVDEQRNTISIQSVTGTAQDLCQLLQ